MSCYAAPGPQSLHEYTAVSRGAFAVLMRVAAGGLCVRDIHEPEAARELVPLLVRGLVRCT
jgi:D-arabinose 1-dehydrogenase-like Zn-dependent alcohol dehydrogenase